MGAPGRTRVALLVTCMSAGVAAQKAPPAFDVTSVKSYVSGVDRRPTDTISVLPGGRFSAPSAALRGLIAAAYGILDIQIVDTRRILDDRRFEIEARTIPEVSIDDARAMLRSLLAERFGLVAHRETRELPVYIMSLATAGVLGTQLRRSGEDCAPVKGLRFARIQRHKRCALVDSVKSR